MDLTLKSHWNQAYLNKSVKELGWYEEIPEPSLELVKKSGIASNERLLIAGAGTSTLVDHLLQQNFQSIMVCDISNVALDLLEKRIGSNHPAMHYLHDDLTEPKTLIHEENFKLWIDRAVFHFFTEPYQQEAYKRLLDSKLDKGAKLIIAAFAPGTAAKCSGLDVKHHTVESLQEFLGEDYRLEMAFENLYTQPSGNTRDYIYALFEKRN